MKNKNKYVNDFERFKPSKVALIVGAVLFSSVAIEQNAVAEEVKSKKTKKEVVEVIEVTGIKSSFESAILEKRAADIITDGISADDLGNFPDLNLGEALQRIPGVQIDRESSRRSATISVRGLPGTYALTTVQGQNVASAATAGRSANPFGMFDSSIFSGAYVVKSFTSDIQSGGLSANVDLRIKSALDRKDGSVVVRAEGAYEESTEAVVPKLFISGSKHFNDGKIGVYGTLAWQEMDFRRDQILFNGYNEVNQWVDIDRSQYEDNAVLLWSGQYRQLSEISKGDRISSAAGFEYELSDTMSLRLDGIYAKRNLDDARLNTMIVDINQSAAQITPTDITYVGNTNQISEGEGEPVVLEPTYVINQYNYIDPDVHFEDRSFPHVEETYAIYPQFNFENDKMKGRVLGTFSEASNLRGQQQYRLSVRRLGNKDDVKNWNGVYGSVNTGLGNWDDYNFGLNIPDNAIAFLGDGKISGNTVSINALQTERPNLVATCDAQRVCEKDANGNIIYTEHASQKVGNSGTIAGGASAAKRTLKSIGTDWEFYTDNMGPLTSVKVGGIYQSEESVSANNSSSATGLNVSNFPQPALGTILLPSESVSEGAGFFGGENNGVVIDNYLSVNIPVLNDHLFPVDQSLNPDNRPLITDEPLFSSLTPFVTQGPIGRSDSRNFTSERETVEAYVMGKFDGVDYNIPVRGNFGLRYVDSTLKGRLNNPLVANAPDAEGEYSAVLPSLNIIYDVSEDLIANFAYYETFEAFDITEFSPAPTLYTENAPNPDEDDGEDDAPNVGNVALNYSELDLEPRTSIAYDLGLTWYNRKGSLIGLNYFYKEVKGDIDSEKICPEDGVSGTAVLTNEAGERTVGDFSTGPLFVDNTTCRINEGFTGEELRQNRRINIFQKVNVGEVIKVKGYEFQITQNLDFLDGIWQHFGGTFNYTNIDFDNSTGESLSRVSPQSYNLIGFYEDERLGVRLAYNWRDEYEVEGVSTFLQGARTVAARGQLDAQVNYRFDHGWHAKLQLFNLTDENPTEYEFVEELNRRTQYDGRTVRLSVQKQF